MNNAYIYLAIAVLLASSLIHLALRRSRRSLALDDARAMMDSLDILAFRNLVNPQEEDFLRSSLPKEQFRKIRRERAWAALAYVRSLSQIALAFSRLGHVMRNSPDLRQVELGAQIVNSAVLLRLSALNASGRLFIAAAFPGLPLRYPQSLFEQYARSMGLLLRYRAADHAQEQAS